MPTELRQRVPNGTPKKQVTTNVEVEDSSSRVVSALDVLRILVTLIVLVFAASYYVTSGSSLIFGQPRPWWTKPAQIKHYFGGPIDLTPAELKRYDGSNPDLPIYLAVNGTIFDVTAGAHSYGPGGGYHAFAGHDASRGFVTGCFMEDRTADLRGAEEVYLPVEDDPSEEISNAERKTRAEREKRLAKKKVLEEVAKWHQFYSDSKKYFKVGRVLSTETLTGPVPTLCAVAEKGRPKRSNMNKNKKTTNAAPGKPVQ